MLKTFAFRFCLACTVVFALASVAPEPFWAPVNRHTAAALAASLAVSGVPATAWGDVVSGGGFSVRIVYECTPVLVWALCVCFVAACPASWPKRAAGIAIGLPALYLLNHLRLMAVYLTGIHWPRAFDLVHVYLGQTVMVAATLLICLLWLQTLSGNRGSSRAGAFFLRFAWISIPLCALWAGVNRDYVALLDGAVTRLFSLGGPRFVMKREHALYFQTFNIVTLVSLVLASTRMSLPTKWRALSAGIALAVGFHLLFRLLNLVLAAYGHSPLYHLAMLVTTAGQYVLPPVVYFAYLDNRKSAPTPGGRPKGPRP